VVDWSCLQDPRLREVIERALDHVKKLEAEGKSWRDFELHEIQTNWWDARRLVYDYGIFKITYKSSSHTFYAFAVPIEEVEAKLREVKAVPKEFKPTAVPDELRVPDHPSKLFDLIEGYDDYKWLVWKALVKWAKGGRPAHFLLSGPPATAKTMFLECIEAKVGRTIYVAGEAARRGGFVERVIEGYARWGDRWILEVDELDKLDADAMKTVYNLMEGRLDVAVHGKQVQDRVDVLVIATTNQYWRIPEALRSRFGKPLEFAYYNQEQYVKAVIKALENEGVPRHLAEAIAEKTAKLGVRDPRVARQVARLVDSEEEVDDVLRAFGYK